MSRNFVTSKTHIRQENVVQRNISVRAHTLAGGAYSG